MGLFLNVLTPHTYKERRIHVAYIKYFTRIETNSVFEGVLDMVCLGTAVYFTRDEK